MRILDLGTGTGFFALLLAKWGASHVYGVDTSPAIEIAKKISKENKLDDKVTFIHTDSRDLKLPSRVDLIVSDLRGALPLFGSHLSILFDAKNRFLKPEGHLLPKLDEIHVALVQVSAFYTNLVRAYGAGSSHTFWDAYGTQAEVLEGLNFSAALDPIFSTYHRDLKHRIRPKHLMSKPSSFARIRYGETPPSVFQKNMHFTLDAHDGSFSTRRKNGPPLNPKRDAPGPDICPTFVNGRHRVDGFAMWFESELCDGISLHAGPHSNALYGSVFFPWPEPLWLKPGEQVALRIFAEQNGDDWYWAWSTSSPDKRFHQAMPFESSLLKSKLASFKSGKEKDV